MKLTSELYLLPTLKYHISGSKIVFRDQFQGNPWIHFCNSYFVYVFFLFMNKVLLKINRGTSSISGIFNSHDLFFFVTLLPNAGYGLLIHEVSRSHTTTHHSR